MRSFALFTLAIPALVALAAPSAEDPKLRARQCYVDRSGGPFIRMYLMGFFLN